MNTISFKVAIISSHPIQYNAPLFKLMAALPGWEIHVFYTLGKQEGAMYDQAFQKKITWDIPLLEGYQYSFERNEAEKKGTARFSGIKNPDLIKHVKGFQPDGIIVFGWSFHSHLKLMRYFKGKIPILFRGDSTLVDSAPGWKNRIRKVILTWVYKHIDHALYVGQHNKKYFERFGLLQEQLIFGPHAIDNSRFSLQKHPENSIQAEKIKQELGIGQEDIVILFAGKLEPKKNPALLLEVFQRIKKEKEIPAHLVFVGSGLQEKQLREQASEVPDVHFIGFVNQSQMPAYYALSNVFILPSNGPGETWGLCINEAMAVGRCVVVSNKCGCAPDLVRQGENGFVFPAGNREALYEVLVDLITNPVLVQTMGKKSSEIIQDYSYQNIIRGLEDWKKLVQDLKKKTK